MQDDKDIFRVLREFEHMADTASRKAAIIQPGAIGDCILTLPLARYLKQTLDIGSVDMIGHTSYIDYFVNRTDIDGIRSIDSIGLHKLFADSKTFDIEDNDPLLGVFRDYSWIITFLNDAENNFEQNLIYLANCTHPAEITSIDLKPPADFNGRISQFYIAQYMHENHLPMEQGTFDHSSIFITPTDSDREIGLQILNGMGLSADSPKVIIAPGSGGAEKCWAIDNFIALAETLKLRNFQPCFILGPAEQEKFSGDVIAKLKSTAPILTDLDLSEVLAAISASDLFIGNDTGLSHLAGCAGTKTIAIFGPTNTTHYKPLGPKVETFTVDERDFAKLSQPSIQKILDVI